jgi:hypothetical protein
MALYQPPFNSGAARSAGDITPVQRKSRLESGQLSELEWVQQGLRSETKHYPIKRDGEIFRSVAGEVGFVRVSSFDPTFGPYDELVSYFTPQENVTVTGSGSIQARDKAVSADRSYESLTAPTIGTPETAPTIKSVASETPVGTPEIVYAATPVASVDQFPVVGGAPVVVSLGSDTSSGYDAYFGYVPSTYYEPSPGSPADYYGTGTADAPAPTAPTGALLGLGAGQPSTPSGPAGALFGFGAGSAGADPYGELQGSLGF